MKMCQNHWDMLRQEINDQGLSGWIAPDGKTAMAQLVENLSGKEDTPTNFDPLMRCHMMIMSRSTEIAGLRVFTEEFGCPICFFNNSRNEDGSCPCGNPECGGAAPGSIPNFETWLVGPESCVTSVKQMMVEKGFIGV